MAQARRTTTARGSSTSRAGASKAATTRSSGYRGEEGRRKMEEVHAQQEAQREAARSQNGMPFRFFVKPGETTEVVVIDEAPDFFRWEHNLKDGRTGKWTVFTACIDEHANCPVCQHSERQAYYAMYLTIIDLTPYTTKDGDEVEWSKKLMVVKSTQQKKISRLYERHGTLRGMVLQMTRDGDKDAAIGNDIEFIEFMDEEELEGYVNVYTDQNGKEVEIVGYEPFDYDELFPEPTEEHLRAIVGGKAEPGSREDDDRTLNRGRGRGRDDSDWDKRDDRKGGTSRPARGASRRAEPEDDEPAEEAPPRRASRTAARGRQEEAEPAPQRQRTASRRTSRDDDDKADEPPPRGASMADRRRALRRNGG